jgi:hypothetical protein
MGERCLSLRDGLERVAKEDGVPLSDVCHDAIVAYLKRRGIRG